MFRMKKIPWNKNKYYHLNKNYFLRNFIIILLLIMLSFAMGSMLKEIKESEAVPTLTNLTINNETAKNMGKVFRLFNINQEDLADILAEGMPSLKRSSELSITSRLDDFFHSFLVILTGLDPTQPYAILGKELILPINSINQDIEIPANVSIVTENNEGEYDFYLEYPDLDSDWIPSNIDDIPGVELDGDPMVLVYNTHNAETYLPTDGKSKLEGKNAGIVTVAKYLSKALESQHSLKTLRSDVIHDYPDWAKSYLNSMHTVTSLLKVNPKIQAVIDIHRDAGLSSRNDTLVKINGKEAAKVMIVIGTEHPKYKQNLAFAQKIKQKADVLYPGLIKDVRLRENRRYNQNLHPRAILLEVGSDLNKLEDAIYSGQLIGDIIGKVLKGE